MCPGSSKVGAETMPHRVKVGKTPRRILIQQEIAFLSQISFGFGFGLYAAFFTEILAESGLFILHRHPLIRGNQKGAKMSVAIERIRIVDTSRS